MVAIVGARNGSAIGQKFTRQIATELGIEGFVIASGLARGIDTAAHLAALERGTAAVLAGGIDIVYPPENAELQRSIGERGLLLTERSPVSFRAERTSRAAIGSFRASHSVCSWSRPPNAQAP
jgi:DNA processing protein